MASTQFTAILACHRFRCHNRMYIGPEAMSLNRSVAERRIPGTRALLEKAAKAAVPPKIGKTLAAIAKAKTPEAIAKAAPAVARAAHFQKRAEALVQRISLYDEVMIFSLL